MPVDLDAKLAALYTRTGGHLIKYDLDTTRALLREMAVDPLALPCIHVAGTSGKGSTSAMIAAALRAASLRTALYTSPHLLRFNERIRIGNDPIPDSDLHALLDEATAADARQAALPSHRPATFFEITTAIAFAWFLRRRVDVAVVETGLGGRLDATNVVLPLLSVVTDIALEHTDILGTTLEQIAAEKGGIAKPGRPLVLNTQPEPVHGVLAAIAAALRCPLVHADRTLSIRRLSLSPAGQKISVETPDDGPWKPFVLPLLGDFQLRNAALAIAALATLRTLRPDWDITPETIRTGLSALRWPGRCQPLADNPPVLLDVGHAPDEAAALAAFLKIWRKKRPVHLVAGLVSGKDAANWFRRLRPETADVVLVPLETERAMPLPDLAAAARAAGYPTPRQAPDLASALALATDAARADAGRVLVAGSLYLGAAALRHYRLPAL